MAEFAWSQEQKGLILSISSYGILLSPFGGLLANKIGGATVFGTALAINGILTILTSYIIRLNMMLFVLVRLLEGISEVSTNIKFAHSYINQMIITLHSFTKKKKLIGFYRSQFNGSIYSLGSTS